MSRVQLFQTTPPSRTSYVLFASFITSMVARSNFLELTLSYRFDSIIVSLGLTRHINGFARGDKSVKTDDGGERWLWWLLSLQSCNINVMCDIASEVPS
jgi:hypothetical protein